MAYHKDIDLLFLWRNLPEIVALGSSNKTVDSDEHISWLSRILSDTNSRLYIICLDSKPIGQLRFDSISLISSEISIFLIPGYTGCGYGSKAIKAGCKQVFKELSIHEIVAFVKNSNHTSGHFFKKVGFEIDDDGPQRPGHFRFNLNR